MTKATNTREIPSGRNVARVFPWWAQARWVPDAVPSQGKFVIAPRSESFKNKLDGPIEIHEIRLLSFTGEYTFATDWIDYTDLSAETRIMINSSHDNLVEQWIPVRAFGNRPHDVMSRPKMGTRVRIPAPYFLQDRARFRIDLRLPPNMIPITNGDGGYVGEVLSDVYLDVALRGWDPDNSTPLVMNKQVQLPGLLTDQPTVVSFDEEMDTALRNMIIDDITFGFIDPHAEPKGLLSWLGPGGCPLHLDVRFHPNTGPEWVEGNEGWIRLAGLMDPPSMIYFDRVNDLEYFPYIVHRPEAPIVLKTKDELNILVRREVGNTAHSKYEQHFCWVLGTQEVPS